MFCLIIQNLSAQLCVLFCHSLSFIEFTCWEFSSWLSGRMPDSKEVSLPLPFYLLIQMLLCIQQEDASCMNSNSRECRRRQFQHNSLLSVVLHVYCWNVSFICWLTLEHVAVWDGQLLNTNILEFWQKSMPCIFLLFDNERKGNFLATLTAICNHLV